MTCTAMSSKPAATIRWMKGDKELPGGSEFHYAGVKMFPQNSSEPSADGKSSLQQKEPFLHSVLPFYLQHLSSKNASERANLELLTHRSRFSFHLCILSFFFSSVFLSSLPLMFH